MNFSATRYFPHPLGTPSSSQRTGTGLLGTSVEGTPSQDAQPVADQDYERNTIISPLEVSDEHLLEFVSQGSREALAILFRRHARVVRSVAYRVLRDPSEADDLLQDVFLLIHRMAGSFESSKGSARFWMLQMTYRRALTRRRYLSTRHFYNRLDLEEVAQQLPDPRTKAGGRDHTLDGVLGAGKVNQGFATLSENQRQTLLLYFVEGYTLSEIAQKLGQSLGNVKHHYFRGLEKLRKELLGPKFETETTV